MSDSASMWLIQAQIHTTLSTAPAAAPLNFIFMLEERESWKGP